MNTAADQIAKILFQKNTAAECTAEEILELVNRHPYFGAVRILLLDKLKHGQPEKYQEEVQRTLLYFNNPLWFQIIHSQPGNAEILPASDAAVSSDSDADNLPDSRPAFTEMKKSEEPETAHQQEELIFEPYHTVDYFASQGIQLKEEENPADRFGRQLKSFTDWLKTMKRLPETAMQNLQPASEEKVEHLAGLSLKDSSVITEAMAEVWTKQGNYEKAIEVYLKLSLQNPSKSSYFAAKIEQLKQL
jgi:hypothetical protein